MATLLELDLTTPLLEAPPHDPIGTVLARRRTLLRDVLEGLALGADDPQVSGLIAHVGPHGPELAHVQEIRDAVRRFAASSKPSVAWSESFGELGPGTVCYYLASAFDQIWIQPSGSVGLTGVAAEAIFVRDALAKLGVVAQLSQRHEYKSAAEMFLSDRMSDAHREAADRVTASTMEQVVGNVATCRGLSVERVRELVNQAPIPARDAHAAGLVDRLGYRDEAYTELRQRLERSDAPERLQFVHRYRRAKHRDPHRILTRLSQRPSVAVIHATGNIHLGRSGRPPFAAGSIGSDTLSAALRAAASADSVSAVVLRVNSGGGSYVASDAIRREVVRLREAGKPVVVSMGALAASGGYFIAMAADAVLAQPTTLTGSIGVLGGKTVTRDLLSRLGITRDSVSRGDHARMFSTAQEFSDSEWERLETWLDQVYDDFTEKVALDRGLPRDHVDSVARGRVWTGADAHEHRLIDELGGVDRAVQVAATHAGLRREDIEVTTMPRFGMLERIRPAESSEDIQAAQTSALPRIAERDPAAVLAESLGLTSTGVLTAPVLWRLR